LTQRGCPLLGANYSEATRERDEAQTSHQPEIAVSIVQLDTSVYVTTPFGKARCDFLWEHNDELWWGCWQDQTGEIWWWPNPLVRLTLDISDGRYKVTAITLPPGMKAALTPHVARYEGVELVERG